MFNKYLNSVPILILFLQLNSILADKAKTDSKKAGKSQCDKEKADRCALQIVLLTNEKFIKNPPTTIPALNKWCKTLKPLEDCLKEFGDTCLSSEGRKTLSVALYSTTRTNKRYCNTPKRKNDLLKLVKCGAADFKKFAQVFHNFTQEAHAIKYFNNEKLKIPMACCTYFKYRNLAVELFEKKCSHLTDDLEKLINAYTGDFLNLSCGDYTDDSDKCESILPQVPKWTKPLEWRGFLIPLTQIFEDI